MGICASSPVTDTKDDTGNAKDQSLAVNPNETRQKPPSRPLSKAKEPPTRQSAQQNVAVDFETRGSGQNLERKWSKPSSQKSQVQTFSGWPPSDTGPMLQDTPKLCTLEPKLPINSFFDVELSFLCSSIGNKPNACGL